jgi:hypothetical protein
MRNDILRPYQLGGASELPAADSFRYERRPGSGPASVKTEHRKFSSGEAALNGVILLLQLSPGIQPCGLPPA